MNLLKFGIHQATEYYGGAKNTTNIQACCRGAKKSAFGFKWKYVD